MFKINFHFYFKFYKFEKLDNIIFILFILSNICVIFKKKLLHKINTYI